MKFAIQGKDVTDCRLRAYDPLMQVRLAVIDDYNAALMTLSNLNVRATLDLEFKDDEGNFEEYNVDWLHLKAAAYEDGMTYDFSQPDSFPTKIVKINKSTDKVSDLEKKLSEILDIPEAELIILLRHEKSYNNSISTEYYNMPWRKDKKISEVSKFEHGTVLYCEQGNPSDSFDQRLWK